MAGNAGVLFGERLALRPHSARRHNIVAMQFVKMAAAGNLNWSSLSGRPFGRELEGKAREIISGRAADDNEIAVVTVSEE